MPDSSISKFFEKSRKDRLDIVANFANLSNDELDILQNNQWWNFYMIKQIKW